MSTEKRAMCRLNRPLSAKSHLLMRVLAIFALFASRAPAADPQKTITPSHAERTPLYVETWTVAPEIRLSGRALEVALCVHLMKDARIDGQCESDLQQILRFAGESALAGNRTPAIEQVENRTQKSRWLIRGEVSSLPSQKWRMSLTAYAKDPSSLGIHLVAGAAVASVETEVALAQQPQVLTLVPRLADRLLDKLVGEQSLENLPPPKPLSPSSRNQKQ